MRELCVGVVLRLVGLTEGFGVGVVLGLVELTEDLCVGVVLGLVGLAERIVHWNCDRFSGTD
jgi:hypothetical protein